MDQQWWLANLDEVNKTFTGARFTVNPLNEKFRTKNLTKPFHAYGNSGAGAISLAVMYGATKVILIGYDCQHTGGKKHWHDDHGKGMTNAARIDLWHGKFQQLAEDYRGVSIVNCTRETALKAFPLGSLESELSNKPAIVVEGMHGLGDCLHQRGVIRELKKSYDVWLETPWPSLYTDMEINLITKGSSLRTQAKNAAREAGKFSKFKPPVGAKRLIVAYPPSLVRKCRSVYAAMSAKCGVPESDFRLTVKNEWLERADQLIASWNTNKPILIYRPLVERKEWGGNKARNPDENAYKAMFDAIQQGFFVVSVADLEENKEWQVGKRVKADIEYHKGELDIEILAGLFKRASLVFTSPGFAVVLAQSVGTAVISVFGGYESAYSFSSGEKYAPYLGINPITPCDCFSHGHKCKKAIDIPDAMRKAKKFSNEAKQKIGTDQP